MCVCVCVCVCECVRLYGPDLNSCQAYISLIILTIIVGQMTKSSLINKGLHLLCHVIVIHWTVRICYFNRLI